MIKKFLLFLILAIQLFARNTTVNLEHIENFLNEFQPSNQYEGRKCLK